MPQELHFKFSACAQFVHVLWELRLDQAKEHPGLRDPGENFELDKEKSRDSVSRWMTLENGDNLKPWAQTPPAK